MPRSSIMRRESSTPMPAIGSSSSSSRGRSASAMASSSCRCSPCDMVAASTSPRSPRPTSWRICRAGAMRSESWRASRQKRKLCPACACTASMTFSSAVKSWYTLVIWNERARPLRARRGAPSAVMSSPAKTMRPASGRRSPASCRMNVVLPAPFGPMTACVSPSRTSKSIASLARRAPKVLVSPRTSSMENPGEAALEEDHREHEQRSEDYLPVLGPALEDFLGDEQHEGAEHRAGGARHAAEDHHEHQVAGLHPAREPGSDVVRVVRVEGAGETADRPCDDECREAVAIGRKSDRPRARFIRLCGADHHAEARVHHSMGGEDHEEHQGEAEVIEAHGIAQIDEAGELAAATQA